MKIGETRQVGTSSVKRAAGSSSSGSVFRPEGMEEGRGVAGLSATSSLAAVDSLLALQQAPGLGDAMTGSRRAIKRGEQMLDILDDIKIALLSGSLPQSRLQRLLHVVESQQAQFHDPKLADILAHIELRARVELAKFGTAAHG